MNRRAGTLLISLLIPALAAASVPKATPKLAPLEREKLRYRLELLFNEVDLTLRNEKTDAADVARQEREAGYFRLYDRIPFKEDLPGLKKELARTAGAKKLRLTSFKVTGRSRPGSPVPKVIPVDGPTYRIRPEQLAREIHFELEVQGEPKNSSEGLLQDWIASWKEDQIRLVVPEGDYRKVAPGRFRVRATAFKFERVEFPKLKMRDPFEYLPAWARKDPKTFARVEPLLWKYVVDTRELSPKTAGLYETKRRFLLNHDRMEFYLSKVVAKASS